MTAKSLSAETAAALAQAAHVHAKKAGLKPLGFVVVGADTGVRAALVQDNATLMRFDAARAKATGALRMGRATSRDLETLALERPALFQAFATLAQGQLIPAAGAVVFADSENQILGAIGVSGDTSDNDEICALAAIEECGLKPWRP